MRLHCLQHVPFEEPAFIEEWAKLRSFSFELTRLFEVSHFPAQEDFDALIVMGGPMGVYEQEKFPWLSQELSFIKEAIGKEKKVMGICLGAQLLAYALGAKVYPHTQREIGWFPIEAVDGEKDPLFSGFPSPCTVFHWHGDTFELPSGAQNFFRSQTCENQAFLFGGRVLGLQFHLEVSQKSLEKMVLALPGDLRPEGSKSSQFQYVQNRSEILAGSSQSELLRPILYTLLDRFFLNG